GGREPDAEGQLAGRLLLHIDLDDGLVRAVAGNGPDVDLAEVAEILDPLPRSPEPGGVEGVAFDQPELAANDLVESPHVAGDVDPLDEHARAFLNVVGQIDDLVLAVSLKARLNVDERVTELADGVGERADACLDLGRIIPIPGLGGDVV